MSDEKMTVADVLREFERGKGDIQDSWQESCMTPIPRPNSRRGPFHREAITVPQKPRISRSFSEQSSTFFRWSSRRKKPHGQTTAACWQSSRPLTSRMGYDGRTREAGSCCEGGWAGCFYLGKA
jgi:hypothetical protein